MKSLPKKVARLSGLAVVSIGLVVAQLAYAPSANAAEQVLDGGFEATVMGDSPSWTEDDSLFDSPLCTASCGFDFAHTGNWWAWFGGDPEAGHTGSLSQSVTIPTGTTALSYFLLFAGGTAPFDATLQVKVDGTTLKTHTERLDEDDDYIQQFVDISAFDDGDPHTISFDYLNGAEGLTAFMVDDVSIDTTVAPVTTVAPAVTAVDPAGPSSSTTPKVKGTAPAGSTVTLYPNSTCTGAAVGQGTQAEFAGAGITANVPSDATTTIYATATGTGEFESVCSSTSASYVNDATSPDTAITVGPTGGVAKSLTVPVAFTSTETPSTFTCSLDSAAFTACTSPTTLTVTPGQHTFRVTAKDAVDNADTTPASVTFTAYNCATLTAAVTSAQTNVDTAAKAVTKAKKALKKAKKSGKAHKIKKAKKKLKKAKAAQATAAAALTAAQGAAAPCGGASARSTIDRR